MDITVVDKSFDEKIYKKARKLRQEMAQRLIDSATIYVEQDDTIQSSMFATMLERNPFGNTKQVIEFNILITDKLCDELLHNNDGNLIETIALYSCVMELGAREFINPHNPDKTSLHLSAAKNTGYFFTPASLALRMVVRSLEYAPNAISVFDPACGAGVFLAFALILSPKIQTLVGIEIDNRSSVLANKLLNYVNTHVGRKAEIKIKCMDYFDYFEECKNGTNYDVIIMNPPYGNLKFLESDLSDISTKANVNSVEHANLCKHLRNAALERSKKLRCQFYNYGLGKGVLEYSKLFMISAIELLSPSGLITAITPSSWLGDEASVSFRKNVFSYGYLRELWMIPESANIFKGVNQPTVVSILGRAYSSSITVADPVMTLNDVDENSSSIDLQSMIAVSGNKFKFPKCKISSIDLLKKLRALAKMKDLDDIVNLRGELDLTKYKQYVSVQDTGTRLIRGDHIQGYFLLDPSCSDKAGYVFLKDFIDSCTAASKVKYIGQSRIASPQCSYLNKKKRIEAAIIPPNSVVSNSCNFISVKTSDHRSEREFLYWMVLNSTVVEWQFRIFSYNNHVGNSELNELSFISYDSISDDDRELLQSLMDNAQSTSIYTFDAFVAKLFNLTGHEYSMVLSDISPENAEVFMTEFYSFQEHTKHSTATIPQHQLPSLSELDKVMISYVEPGGNWTSIPDSVPSKRLDQIRAMAKERGMVRTTYYSRLRYDQPAYTISTYYNRPGNGANIHPWEDRTLSSREAARLQSFPDSFVFEGNEAAIRTQIGNAVPPLLGYAIGKAIMKKSQHALPFCDVFAGAGGLSYGLELAGFNGVAALEINKDAAKTFIRNHSEKITTVIGDINSPIIQNELITAIQSRIPTDQPWIMVGGPPCQGFSTAGYRDENDLRNKLVDSYLRLIAHLKPTIVVMENVHGILSMSKGKVIDGVFSSLHALGYVTHSAPWILDAERYGVPQMRKRVVIVAAKDYAYLPEYPTPLFDKCLGRREQKDGQMTLIPAKYPITVGEALYGLPPLMPINSYFPTNISINPIYNEWCLGHIGVEEMLIQRSK